jgi:hypothetical protein
MVPALFDNLSGISKDSCVMPGWAEVIGFKITPGPSENWLEVVYQNRAISSSRGKQDGVKVTLAPSGKVMPTLGLSELILNAGKQRVGLGTARVFVAVGFRVAVGGTGVDVAVAVAGTGVTVGETGVAVTGTGEGVLVAVVVGGMAVGLGTGVDDGAGVTVGIVAFAGPQPFTRSKINSNITENHTECKFFEYIMTTPWPLTSAN